MRREQGSASANATIALLVSLGWAGGRLGGLHPSDWLTPGGYMRISDIKATMAAQGVFHAAASNVVNAVLLALSSPVAAVCGWASGLGLVAPLFGPFCMAAFGGALGWAMTPFLERRWHAVVTITACLPVISLGLPGTVDGYALLPPAWVIMLGVAGRFWSACRKRPAKWDCIVHAAWCQQLLTRFQWRNPACARYIETDTIRSPGPGPIGLGDPSAAQACAAD